MSVYKRGVSLSFTILVPGLTWMQCPFSGHSCQYPSRLGSKVGLVWQRLQSGPLLPASQPASLSTSTRAPPHCLLGHHSIFVPLLCGQHSVTQSQWGAPPTPTTHRPVYWSFVLCPHNNVCRLQRQHTDHPRDGLGVWCGVFVCVGGVQR